MADAPRSSFATIVWIFVLGGLDFPLIMALVTYGGSPGAPIAAEWAVGVLLAITALITFPPLLRRLPAGSPKFAWLLAVGALIGGFAVNSSARQAFEQTPEGRRIAEQYAAQERQNAAEERQRAAEQAQQDRAQQAMENTERSLAQAQAYADSVERCFSTFGHRLSNLEAMVQESLHNPRSFEHVRTEAIVPDAQGYNVAMVFRGENGFGAIRTATVRAKLIPDGCQIQEVSTPEVE